MTLSEKQLQEWERIMADVLPDDYRLALIAEVRRLRHQVEVAANSLDLPMFQHIPYAGTIRDGLRETLGGED